ncbi:Conserved_hypothetical protein [Hexamita inflata]|uniref:Dynein regulatory complex protein 10 n=1 Tax=Hexamita inflata TaxID=28002 RepID=A0AA86UAF6_9EUKA|nr:Conserved hypothetical protein [Hexamita inflata]CAI9964674.1 Conserved hypothetical protein [Hexamita inflata]CAI9973336.1 Conserved hypothetical protein [Hexamita inflata]
MNKLIAVEACRCLSVISDMISTLEQLQYVTSVLQSRVDFDATFGKSLADRLRECIRTRQQLESAIQDQNVMKAGGFRSRQTRLEKRIAEATTKFTKEIHELTMIFSQSTDFLDKVKLNVNNLAELLPQGYVQVGGQGGKSVASGSVAQDGQGQSTTAGQHVHFSSIKELIETLQHMYQVVHTNMNTSVQQEQNKKQHISLLSNSEQNMRNLVSTYQRDEKNMLEQIEVEENQLQDQIKTIIDQLQQNGQFAEDTTNSAFQTVSQNEQQNNDQFLKKNQEFALLVQDHSRKLNENVKKALEGAKEMQKQRRRFYLGIRDDMKKLDAECNKLDEDIYRLKYEINLSNERIGVLNKEIEVYNADKQVRDNAEKGVADIQRRHEEYWDLKDLMSALEQEVIKR